VEVFMSDKDYIKDNERAKKALKKEEEFLKKDVIGQAAEEEVPLENKNTSTEKKLESD
tara:strand:+ start:17964 stop:18137 length:174 start_codon:yes stop_codon:yes gene_type:complete